MIKTKDLIGICYDEEGKSTAVEFHSARISIRANTRLISHPVENGTSVFDNKVIEPREITVTGYVKVSDKKLQDEISKMLRTKTYRFYSVVTGESVYKKLSLKSSTVSESTEKIDVLEYSLVFQEIIFSSDVKVFQNDDDFNRVVVGTIGGR